MRLSRPLMQLALLGSVIFFTTPTFAQESKIETQAVRCLAMYSVFTDAEVADASLSKTLHQLSVNFASVYTNERNKKTATTPEDVLQRRDLVLKEFEQSYKNGQAHLMEEAILCGAWGEGFLKQGPDYDYVPILPKIVPQKVRDDYAALASAAFKKWHCTVCR